MAARIKRVEPQTCPRRTGELGPWPRTEGLDWWETGRWAATQGEADAEVADFMSTPGAGGIGHVLWSYGGEQPRTCSFCGGIHPDDAVTLLKAGWEVGVTDKGYKRYLEPPGHREHHEALMQWLRGGREGEAPEGRYPSPVPPVKVYTMHFSPEQVEAFNAALRGPT
jgi:hypothetical protein